MKDAKNKALEKAKGGNTKPDHSGKDCGYKCVFHSLPRKVKRQQGAFSTQGSRKARVEAFTKHIEKGPKGFLTGHN